MEDIKITVLRLGGCGWCGTVIEELGMLNLGCTVLDANENEEQADRLEQLLDTLLYPIITLEVRGRTRYIYRTSNVRELNTLTEIGPGFEKIGCNTISSMIDKVKEVLKY